jgi:DNA-directed RNA polymerase specialized sigma24 family protein
VVSDTDLDALMRSSEAGDAGAREALFTILYAELHKLAQRQLRRNSALTLSPTTLLHETYLDMSRRSAVFPDHARFLAYASAAPSDALDSLARVDSRLAQVVDLKYFCGFTFAEIAAALGTSERTVKRDSQKVRILLQHELSED